LPPAAICELRMYQIVLRPPRTPLVELTSFPDPRVELLKWEEWDRNRLKRGEEIEGDGRDGENFQVPSE